MKTETEETKTTTDNKNTMKTKTMKPETQDEKTESHHYKNNEQNLKILFVFILKEDLENGEEVATCPSCSLIVKVIYDKDLFQVGEIIEAPSHAKLEVVQS
uniref:DPH-type MB domain-containing protein n=1 Tax=Neolamprologus brichardi TaxID=32507 RepID=A0A3Q4HG76_NEOBR